MIHNRGDVGLLKRGKTSTLNQQAVSQLLLWETPTRGTRVPQICPETFFNPLFNRHRKDTGDWRQCLFFFYVKNGFHHSVPMMLSCGPEFAEAEWNKIWLPKKDVGRIQSLCLFVHVKVLTLSLRVAVTWCCLDSSLCLLPPPGDLSL